MDWDAFLSQGPSLQLGFRVLRMFADARASMMLGSASTFFTIPAKTESRTTLSCTADDRLFILPRLHRKLLNRGSLMFLHLCCALSAETLKGDGHRASGQQELQLSQRPARLKNRNSGSIGTGRLMQVCKPSAKCGLGNIT